jgi:type IV secretion system protein VirB9
MKAPLLILPVMLAACATQPPPPPPETPVSSFRPVYTAQSLQVPPRPVGNIDTAPEKRMSRGEIGDMLKSQNEAALVLPNLNCFVGAACEYWYTPDGPPYLVMMEVGNKTDIELQPGEIVNKVSQAGKQTLIPYDKTVAGSGANRTERISFMPRVKSLSQYVTIATDRRFYNLRVETHKAGSEKQHILVRWRYPDDVAANLNSGQPFDASIDRTTGMDSHTRWCGYQISAPNVPFAPVRTPDDQPPVCDDGEVTVVNFALGTLDGGGPSVYTIRDGVRYPVQYEQVNTTYRVAGVHTHLALALGAYEVNIMRQGNR